MQNLFYRHSIETEKRKRRKTVQRNDENVSGGFLADISIVVDNIYG